MTFSTKLISLTQKCQIQSRQTTSTNNQKMSDFTNYCLSVICLKSFSTTLGFSVQEENSPNIERKTYNLVMFFLSSSTQWLIIVLFKYCFSTLFWMKNSTNLIFLFGGRVWGREPGAQMFSSFSMARYFINLFGRRPSPQILFDSFFPILSRALSILGKKKTSSEYEKTEDNLFIDW